MVVVFVLSGYVLTQSPECRCLTVSDLRIVYGACFRIYSAIRLPGLWVWSI